MLLVLCKNIEVHGLLDSENSTEFDRLCEWRKGESHEAVTHQPVSCKAQPFMTATVITHISAASVTDGERTATDFPLQVCLVRFLTGVKNN